MAQPEGTNLLLYLTTVHYHWLFSNTFFQPHNCPGVNPVYHRNEYQESSWEEKWLQDEAQG
jgi:hypothetical protein